MKASDKTQKEFADKFHDIEILGIYKNLNNLNILLDNRIIVLKGIKYWEFTPFDYQNIIFELNYFNIKNVPVFLEEEYDWISNYKSLSNLNLIEIKSSVGLSGVAIFSDLKINMTIKSNQ